MRVMYRKNKNIHFSDPAIYRAFGSYTGIEVPAQTISAGQESASAVPGVDGVVIAIAFRKCVPHNLKG